MMAVFVSDPDIGMVFCDASQIDQNGDPLPFSLWEAIGFTHAKRRRFEKSPVTELLRAGHFTYGMASAFRGSAIRPFCPVLGDPRGMSHDIWFALHTGATGWKGAIVNERLVRYRRHATQTTIKEGLSTNGDKRDWLISRRQKMLDYVESLELAKGEVSKASLVCDSNIRDLAIDQMDKKIMHLIQREALRETRSPLLAARALVAPGYWKYAKGPVSALRDIMGL